MAAFAQQITVTTAPTLLFSCVDSTTYVQQGYTRVSNPQVFIEGHGSDELPLLLLFSPTDTLYLGGSNVSASGANVGAIMTGIPSLAYNCHGGDSLYAITGGGTSVVSLLALRQ